ncbi:hypothetical protein HWV62_19357 [Athelia sp. TMB]|nr:hypothetical protein HWV62_19357 [Athelia sp. TMB]
MENYPQFLEEVVHILRPGGILLITESEVDPLLNGHFSSELSISGVNINVRGWHELWKSYRKCLQAKGIDLTVPKRLRKLLNGTQAFKKIVAQLSDVPVGFWPEDETQLSIGQLSWMEYDLLLPAMEPLLMEMSHKTQDEVKLIIQNAQHDLYYPQDKLSMRMHIVHAIKKHREI